MTLLNKVEQILAEADKQRKLTGDEFNIFFVSGIWWKETIICRVIKELIDVNGSNPVADICLKSFCDKVLDVVVNEKEISTAKVIREKLIDNQRRIDLFLSIGEHEIPIEAKIYAEDQYAQCVDYFEYAVNSPIYYLTLDGHEPSANSKGNLTDGQIECISFRDNIISWLEDCLQQPEVLKIIQVSGILKQLLMVVRRLTGQEGSGVMSEIAKEISVSKDSYRAGRAIEFALQQVRMDMMKKVFNAVEKHIESLDKRIALKEIKTYEKKNLVEEYYTKNKNSWPAVDYVFEYENMGPYSLRFEFGWNFYFGITDWDADNQWNKEIAEKGSREIIKNSLTPKESDGSSEKWHWWKYCFDKECNFRSCDGEYENLFDKAEFKEKMDIAFKRIDAVLKEINIIG